MKTNLKALAVAAVIFAAFQMLASAVDAAEKAPLTVVELYTSQGCSSCPPADAFLGELAKRDDLLALSVHVDYWDYICWKDPFASPLNTQRQRQYARTLGMGYVYTPQMVIQGADHATGSDRAKVLSKIAEAEKTNRVVVKLSRNGGRISIIIPGAPATDEAAVWLVVFDNKHDTAIRRGENAGRTLSYYNVVRGMKRIGTWTGQPMDIPTQAAAMGTDGRDGCAVIVQSLKTGRILGAAKISLN